MNLLLVNYEYPPLGGGAGNATAHLARALASLGHRPYVVTSRYRAFSGWREENGVRILRLPAPRRRIDRSNLFEMAGFVALACATVPFLIRRHGIDGSIVFFSMPCGPIGWLSRLATGRPYVLSLRGGDVPGAEPSLATLQRVIAPVRRASMRAAKAVVANSRGLAEMSQRADPVAVETIANGVDTRVFSPRPAAPRRDGPIRLLFAGRFQGQKNLFELLRQFAAAKPLASVPLRLTLVGDGPQRTELAAEALRLGIAADVDWPGWLDKAALAETYRGSDVFVNPSLYEGMPNTVMEAMACGLPVIASDVPGNNELIRDGETGLLFTLDAPQRLAAAIAAMADDAALRTACGLAGRELVATRYTWEAAARRYADLFKQDPAS